MASLSNQSVSQELAEASTPPAKHQTNSPNSTDGSFDLEKPRSQDGKAQDVADSPTSKEDPNLVTWSGPNDPSNPQNWPFNRKLGITAIWVWANMVTATASSIFSSGAKQVVEEFHVSSTIATLGVSIFLLVSHDRQTLCRPCITSFPRGMQSAHQSGAPCLSGSGASGPCLSGRVASHFSAYQSL